MQCSGGSENNQSSQLAGLADIAKLTVLAKVEFPKKIQILILVGDDYAFISVHVSSFLPSLF